VLVCLFGAFMALVLVPNRRVISIGKRFEKARSNYATHAKWRVFTSRPIPPSTSSEVLLCISCENCEAVDAMNYAAGLYGGTADIHAAQDHGFMYNRSFTDPDGHIWEPMWMDKSAIPK
jgi:uncharacterized protein